MHVTDLACGPCWSRLVLSKRRHTPYVTLAQPPIRCVCTSVQRDVEMRFNHELALVQSGGTEQQHST